MSANTFPARHLTTAAIALAGLGTTFASGPAALAAPIDTGSATPSTVTNPRPDMPGVHDHGTPGTVTNPSPDLPGAEISAPGTVNNPTLEMPGASPETPTPGQNAPESAATTAPSPALDQQESNNAPPPLASLPDLPDDSPTPDATATVAPPAPVHTWAPDDLPVTTTIPAAPPAPEFVVDARIDAPLPPARVEVSMPNPAPLLPPMPPEVAGFVGAIDQQVQQIVGTVTQAAAQSGVHVTTTPHAAEAATVAWRIDIGRPADPAPPQEIRIDIPAGALPQLTIGGVVIGGAA